MKIFNLISLALLAAVFFCQTTIAQETGNRPAEQLAVKGMVIGEGKKPLEGVTVHLKNTKRSVRTDANGNFSINVPGKDGLLVFTFVGYERQEVKVSPVMQVELKIAVSDLGDVVVIAYGTQKKSDITGALSSIKADAIKNVPVVSLEELFKGQAAGLQSSLSSGTPGSASNVNIRGISSIGASTQPLYVIDGMPVAGQSIETGFAESRTA
ncbi:MAG TPA: carboxypeptidase-like regulatory domain-containing protein, partial [Chitinophagaceae bacterium]